jgi:hypothetical protein
MNEEGTRSNEAGAQDPMPELRRLLSGRSVVFGAGGILTDPWVEACLARWAEDGAICPPVLFQAGGDAVLVLSGTTSGDSSEAQASLRTTLAGLVMEGVIRSARWCGEGGVLVAAVDGLGRLTGAGSGESPAGVCLLWTPSAEPAVVLEHELLGEGLGRVLVTVRAEDAGRVSKQAKILGSEASRLGTVTGSGLVIRFGEREWCATVEELLGGVIPRAS